MLYNLIDFLDSNDFIRKDRVKFRINFNNGAATGYFQKDLTSDSAFPFRKGDNLCICIDKEKRRLVIEKENSKESEQYE
jgi:hypothetical protein